MFVQAQVLLKVIFSFRYEHPSFQKRDFYIYTDDLNSKAAAKLGSLIHRDPVFPMNLKGVIFKSAY